MFRGHNTRQLYQSYVRGETKSRNGTGPKAFVMDMREALGIQTTADGAIVRRKVLADGQEAFAPEDASIQQLAKAICGEQWVERLNPAVARNPYEGLESETAEGLEAAEGAIVPGAFPNTSAYFSSIAGLIEAKALDSYNKPEFIADRVCPAQASTLRSETAIGMGRVGDQAQLMVPGESIPLVGMSERWIKTPDTQKRALGVAVTKEAVFFDLTGDVLNKAATVGDELALNKEKRVLRHLVGIDNSYQYCGTSYNTYLTSGNWINKVNPLSLTDWTNLETARLYFSRMTDQESSERIVVTPDTLVVTDGKKTTADHILNAELHDTYTQSAAQMRRVANQERGRYELISSPILEQIIVASGVSAANALEYFVLMSRAGKPFRYMQNWGITAQPVTADSFTMASKGILYALFCDEMGAVSVWEPRHTFLGVPA